MFRRLGKNQDKESSSSLFKEEGSSIYGSKKSDSDIPPRLFDLPAPYLSQTDADEKPRSSEKVSPLSHPFQPTLKEEAPETTLGEGVSFRGQLSFERLLRIDGTFEGELLSQGKIIVGPKGKVKANLSLKEAIIEGKVEGNLTIQERLELRGSASICGDIRAKNMIVDEGVTIIGFVEITNQIPSTSTELPT